jgi:GNAT superfamily N-acetyltransferase
MGLVFIELTDAWFEEWARYNITANNNPNHILADWPHLRWLLASSPDRLSDSYDTLVVKDGDAIVANYGALSATLLVDRRPATFCWYVSGMVLPEYRNRKIGQTFVRMLLGKFDACGVIGFNEGVQKNYERAGFEMFQNKTLRRFLLPLRESTYDLVAGIGEDAARMRELHPLAAKTPGAVQNLPAIASFKEGVRECQEAMLDKVRVAVKRHAAYLNWRYFQNPRREYEATAKREGAAWRAYMVSRDETFQPLQISATRIIDMAGPPESVEPLLADRIHKARDRGMAHVEFSFAGDYYTELFSKTGFYELTDEAYTAWPQVSSPISKRPNHERVCLGSHRIPGLFADIPFNSLYFTRGDSDRDRANKGA